MNYNFKKIAMLQKNSFASNFFLKASLFQYFVPISTTLKGKDK